MSFDAFSRHFIRTFPALIGRRILVALSGGGDSVALLHWLRDPKLRLDLHAAHVHHGVRGAEADADAAFCRDLCHELGVGFDLLKLAPPPPGRGSLEAWWRRERYRMLLDLSDRLGADAVATGHNRDDVAEGVLMQLLRGAGPRALAGISESTSEGVIRPLLLWSRTEIRNWLSLQGLSWREDSSNKDVSRLRNRVRHELLPAMEAIEPAVRRRLEHHGGDLARAEAAFDRVLRDLDAWIRPFAPDGGVPVASLGRLPEALQIRWLHAQSLRAGLGGATRRQGELLVSLLSFGRPNSVTLARRWILRLAAGTLWLEPPGWAPQYVESVAAGRVVDLPIPGWRVRCFEDRPASASSWVHPGLPSESLTVRPPRPGERFRGTRIMDLLGSFPRHLRRSWPVVCCGDTIVWVPGIEALALPEGPVSMEVEHP